MAVVCGAVSGFLAVLDFDSDAAFLRWKEARQEVAERLPLARTGRGVHAFFRTTCLMPSFQFRLAGEAEPAGDLLSEGKICVLPPTVHPVTGKPRFWVREPQGDVPVMTLEVLGVEAYKPAQEVVTVTETTRVGEGSRHRFLTTQAARLRNLGMGSYALEASLHAVNEERCEPPLGRPEVAGIAQWAAVRDVHSLRDYAREELRNGAGGDVPPAHISKGNELPEEGPYPLFLDLPDYMESAQVQEQDWLLEGFLPAGYLVVLGGTSKAGKSCFLTALALHLIDGREFLGLKANAAPVLWAALEETEAERWIAIEAYEGRPSGLWTSHERIRIDKPEGIEALRYWVRRTGARLLVIDPLHGSHGEQTLTDGSAARRVLQPLKELCRTEKVTAVLVHHITKSNSLGMVRERLADSGQILAACSMDVLMDATEKGDGSRELVLYCRGRGEWANQNWVIDSPRLGRYDLVRHGREVGKSAETTDNNLLTALRAMEEGGTAESLAAATGIKVATVRNRLLALEKSGDVYRDGKDGRSIRYRAA